MFGNISKKASNGDTRHFSIANGCLVVKEKVSSDTIKHKCSFSKITKISLIIEKMCLCFLHEETAWALSMEREDHLKKWANIFIYLREEAIKATEALKFPIFEVIPSYTGKHHDFPKEKQLYQYKPMIFKKTLENIFKVFDTSKMMVVDEDLAPKRERSVDILSDDD